MKRFKAAVVCALVVTAMTAQDFSDKEKKVIERGIAIKVDEYRARRWKECRDMVVQAAVRHVDSLIRVGVLVPRIDDVQKPVRPVKPALPPIKTLPDSIDHSLLKRDTSNR